MNFKMDEFKDCKALNVKLRVEEFFHNTELERKKNRCTVNIGRSIMFQMMSLEYFVRCSGMCLSSNESYKY